MKLVIKIGSTCLDDEAALRKFAKAVVRLRAEGHRITVVHGGTRAVPRAIVGSNGATPAAASPANGHETDDVALMVLGGRINKTVVAKLAGYGLTAFGLCGADGHIIRLRKKEHRDPVRGSATEVASVNPLWIDVISNQGAIPVLANIGVGPDGQHHCLDADELAGACATGWDADALVFLTQADGLHNPDGSVMRWLSAEKLDDLKQHSPVNDNMLAKLSACRHALSHGVRRARILPLVHLDSLEQFYFSRIDGGTEVIMASERAANA